MRKGLKRWLGVTLLLVTLAIGLGLLAWLLSRKGLDWAAKISEIASFGLACAAFLWPVIRGFVEQLRDRPPSEMQIKDARAGLKAILQERWRAEKGSHESRVYEALPMRIRFAPTTEAANSSTDAIDMTTDSQSCEGEFSDVLAAFSQEPRYRRVVLGDAGAGKTVLVTELARQLLVATEVETPLPLIMPTRAWNPVKQSLRDWLIQQLVVDYSLPKAYARTLVADGMVLPILDGLDEMPYAFRSHALVRLNEYLVYRPLVVTSRKAEYHAAQKDARVHGMIAVELMALRVADISAYLKHVGGDRWNRPKTRPHWNMKSDWLKYWPIL
jgi:NACHT domain